MTKFRFQAISHSDITKKLIALLCFAFIGVIFNSTNCFAEQTIVIDGGTTEFDDTALLDAYCDLLKMSQGAFGALFALAAGIGGIVAAALGSYRSATSFLVVSLAYFMIPAMINLSFGSSSDSNKREISCAGHGSFVAGTDDIMIRREICDRFQLIEGAWGALAMTVAGFIAIVSVAVGSYKAGYTLVFVGCGAFILRALLSLYFGEFNCETIYQQSGDKIQEFFNGGSASSGG